MLLLGVSVYFTSAVVSLKFVTEDSFHVMASELPAAVVKVMTGLYSAPPSVRMM